MDFETILFEKLGRIARITLNRPQAMNSVSWQLASELGTAVEQFANDPDLWVAIVTATGTRAFCAGMDLKERPNRRHATGASLRSAAGSSSRSGRPRGSKSC
mgnify:CR=1 FL=1